MFRRNSSAGATDAEAQDSQGATAQEAPAKSRPAAEAGKGRPTPKRSEAEANRYRTITGSTTSGRGPTKAPDPKRKLTPEEKDKLRADRNKHFQAQQRGEEWALTPRDRGPAKKLARDYVDAHRRPMEFYMYALILLVIALISGHSSTAINSYMQYFLLLVVVIIVVDAFFLRRSVLRLVNERLPKESTRGLAWYAIMRGLQVRRFRTPKPQLKPGDEF
jgi:hypothetical protein